MQITPRHDFTLVEIDALEDRLYEHNWLATGRNDGAALSFSAQDGDGALIGGVAGYTWAGMSEIRQLWVDWAHRGRGLGRRLVEAAVGEADRRGCAVVFVASYDFQAPGLYERCGFERIAELADFPPGHTNVILKRRLARSESPA